MNEVERIYNELVSIEKILVEANSPSELVAFSSNSSKVMLLAAASYFERRICQDIEMYGREVINLDHIPSFIAKQGLERKYHTLFQWEATNANKFFSLFGARFSAWVKGKVKEESLEPAIRAFLALGNQRNELVHENYATFPVNSTYEEIWKSFTEGLHFIDWFPVKLREFPSEPKEE